MSAVPPTPRQIVVDDSDPSIEYPDDWFNVANITKFNVGNFGAIYNSTTHGVTSDSSLSFPFNGTAMKVYGTIMLSVDAATNATDPTWACLIDGTKIGSGQDPTFPYPENNWVLCEQDEIAAGAHVLTIQVQSKGQTFYLDKLTYVPTPEAVPSATPTVAYHYDDPTITYSAGWTADPDGGTMTQVRNANVSLAFYGTSVSLFGNVPAQTAHNASFATYTLDGGLPVNFTLAGLRADGPTYYDVLILQTPVLPNGPHTLVITHGGDNSTTPLPVDQFFVANTTLAASPSASESPPAHTASPSSTFATEKSSPPIGAIVGGTIAGLVLLAGLVLGAVLWRRARARRRVGQGMQPPVAPYAVLTPQVVLPKSEREMASMTSLSRGGAPARGRGRTGVRYNHHEDSGVRIPFLGAEQEDEIVEVPPRYSLTWR
ncbi:hypothetical protein B0H11DRAFT_1746937 [Mycena galericulata]|nr:hypothetical protein B0H11DRAFT_1746937 [Mycena galericulata]